MPRRRPLTPAYRRDRRSGRATATWKDRAGGRHRKRLPGAFNSPESRAAFQRLRLEVKASAMGVLPKGPPLTVAALLDRYLRHAEAYYRTPDGKATATYWHAKDVGKALCELYADKPAAGFGPMDLKAALQRWANDRRTRSQCNRRLIVVKRVFRWAVSEQLVPAGVWTALTAVAGLRRGRTAARETEPVGPVDDAAVDATLPFLHRHALGLVRFQRLTGCRPQDACAVRRCDIDTTGPVWYYRPPHHKTAHLGKYRVIPIGPEAQAVLREFFTPDPAYYLFSPARAIAELRAERSAARATPRWPSHVARNRRKRRKARERRRSPGAAYTKDSYRGVIHRACDLAFPPPGELAQGASETRAAWWGRLTAEQRAEVKRWQRAHRWNPNQLRHAFATRVRKEFGLEAAQVLLGHARADVTQVYAERNLDLAAAIAAKIG